MAWYATTPQFEAIVRNRLVATLETATGGRVELGSFRWRVLHLEFEADNLTIHGLEGPSEIPYAHIDRLFVRAKIISFFRARVGLNVLEATKPVLHLIVYPDGSTNQPRPKTTSQNGSVTDTLFDLAVDRTEVDHGLLLLNQRAVPFDVAANDLAVSVTYDAGQDHYLANLKAADISAQRAARPPVHSRLSLAADLSRNRATLSQFQLQTGDSPGNGSVLQARGSLNDYNDPEFELTAKGSVDVREVEALSSVPGLQAGVAVLEIQGKGKVKDFAIDGEAKVTGAAYKIPAVRVSGVNGSTSLHITPDELALTTLKGRLPEGGSFEGELHLLHWLAPTPAAPTPKDAVAALAKKTQNLPAPLLAPITTGFIRGQVLGVTLRSVLRIAAPQSFDDLGFETAASGAVSVQWTGNADDLQVSTKVTLAAGDAGRGVPLSGALDATYSNRRGAVDVRRLVAQTPGSHIEVQGSLGVYPISRDSQINADLNTTNLAEFDKTLIALGVSASGPSGRKTGVQAIPIELHGGAEFHGTVTGSLIRPDVKGHLKAANFDTVFAASELPSLSSTSTPATPASVSAPETKPAGPRTASSAPPPASVTDLHWDSLETEAEYSPDLISIDHATLIHVKTRIRASGQLRAHQTQHHRSSFDDESTIAATVSVENESIGDVLAVAGSNAPVSGSINLQATVGGTLGNLKGGGHLAVEGGQIYGEPYHSLTSDLKFNGQELDATDFEFFQDGGEISGAAGYDIRAKTVNFHAAGKNFELAHFSQVQRPNLAVAGAVTFQAHGSGPVKSPAVQATLHISRLVLNSQFEGDLDSKLQLDHDVLVYEANAALDAARFQVGGQTKLTGEYPTQARLTASQVHIERFLRMFNVRDVSSDSVLSLHAEVNGPARQPKLMEGNLDVNRFQISVGGVALRSDADLTAQLHGGVLHVDPLHITGDDTNLQAQGSVELFNDPRGLNFHANGAVNLQLGHSFDPDINSSGHMDFSVDATGTVQEPNLAGQVKFTNGAVSLGDLPNGLSQINGTLVFDQDRLTVQQLTAITGGGRLQIGGAITYQQGLYADLTATGKDIRIRYPQGVSSMADAKLRLQGTDKSLLLGGSILVTRFSISPGLDLASLKTSMGSSVTALPDPNAPSNHVRLDIHITSAPELNFQNSFAKLAGDVDMRVRGTIANPALLGHISVTDGSANFAGTTYQLQRGEIYFSNPIRIDPVIDLDATARVEDYDIDIGLHGTISKLNLTYRSEPPLPEADIFALLALGRTQEEQQIYTQEQQAAGVNSTADALLGGALNATVSSRVQKLFGVGSVKIDPNFVGNLGNSTARITVEEKVGKNATITYATNVNSTAQQLIAGQLFLTQNVSIVAQRDESGVFSLVLKIHQRRR